MAARSTIWGDVDLNAFCRLTGYSREHATRELSRIRAEGEFVFETKLRTKRGADGKKWGVIVADPEKLRFDKHSLFFDLDGKPLHNCTTLGNGGEKIEPTARPIAPRRPRGRPRVPQPAIPIRKRSRGRPSKNPASAISTGQAETPIPIIVPPTADLSSEPSEKSAENTRLCDIPHMERIPKGIQQPEEYGAERDVAAARRQESNASASRRPPALRKKAFVIADKLEACHWDNCKVTFSSRTAFCFALEALADGHDQERIVSCYSSALFVCHGFAVDLAVGTGQIRFFNPSSTVVKARELLRRDGLTRQERIARWYHDHRREDLSAPGGVVDPEELARIHAQIAASFPDH